jgi:hypothetical protein
MRSSSTAVHALVGAVLGQRRLGLDQLLLRGVGAVTVHLLFAPVQQLRQRMLVVHVGRGYSVHADVQLHTEVPQPSLACLVHLGIALTLGVLGRRRCRDDGGVHDSAGANLQALVLQHLPDLGEQRRAQLVLLQQAPELQQRGAVGHPLTPQVNPHEAPQRHAVEQRFLASFVSQIEPVLHEVHAQHALQPNRRAAVAGLGVLRLDHLAQLGPGHDLLHGGEELVAPRRAPVALEALGLIGGHGKGLLLHGEITRDTLVLLTLFSVALVRGSRGYRFGDKR